MKQRRPGWKNRLLISVKKALGVNVLLCDTCKWNWRSACHNRERPNATWCADYSRRGK